MLAGCDRVPLTCHRLQFGFFIIMHNCFWCVVATDMTARTVDIVTQQAAMSTQVASVVTAVSTQLDAARTAAAAAAAEASTAFAAAASSADAAAVGFRPMFGPFLTRF